MLKCPIHELPGNVIIDNFYARLSFQDKTLLDTSCSGSFTRNKEEFKRDLLDRIQENTEGWENDKDRESGIIYDYKCIEAFMDTDKFRNMSATYGLDSQVVANLYKAFASHYELPKKNFDKYHEPYKDKVDSSVNKCVVIETVDNVIPEAYIEKTPFPAKMKEYSVISSAVNKSEKKPKEPEEQIKIEPAVAIVKDLVTENVEDGHIIFCEDASNIVSHPNKPKQVSVPMLSVRIGDHCYHGLCDIGASVSAIPYELYTEIMHEIGSVNLKILMWLFSWLIEKLFLQLVLFEMWKFYVQHLENSESEAFRKERDELEEIFFANLFSSMIYRWKIWGALPPALDLDSFPCVEEAIRVADEFCDQYRALKREVEILQEENQRLRRMLEYYSIPSTRPSPSPSDNNKSLQILVQNCKIEKLKEILMKREESIAIITEGVIHHRYWHPLDDGGSPKGKKRSHGPRPRRAAHGLAAPPVVWGPTALSPPFLRVLLRPENLSHREDLTKGYSRLWGGEHQREKSSPAGRNPGNSLPEGEIDAIAIVIELDIISIIIIIISTIYTAITTAAPRHRCNNLGWILIV
ncbi:hypothetical protein QYE76_062516 [Lolium multiflorum]|uniref:Uncharacterized protein n=1 Tax=Lolium multiflorum TaxID=4521 RepID=A0AAD8S4E4_LOLMU|nr:hypothetical protein QYE76_062516 [Lolium multiflorum]